MENVALGTKVFKRGEALNRLLKSVPSDKFAHIYIADDSGESLAQKSVTDVNPSVETTILDLDYDAGNGFARSEIADRLQEDYLLMVDADHTIPQNIHILYDQLTKLDNTGGIAGSIVEPQENRIWQSGKKFVETDGGLVRDASGQHNIRIVAGQPFAKFDFVPQALLLKSECLNTYSWDRNYTTRREHIDFFMGHWKAGEWDFGASPTVFFGHYPGGSTEYESHRRSEEKHKKDDVYFLEKWEYEFLRMHDPYWFSTDCSSISLSERIRDVYSSEGVTGLLQKGGSLINSILRLK